MIKFEHQWGGEDNWYTKSKRWANKQKFPVNHLTLGLIEWLYKHWVDGKVEMEMASIDKQVKYIGEIWDKEDELNQQPTVEEGPSSVPDLPTLRIRNPVVEGGTEESSGSMAPTSTSIQIPDPWDYSGDWNDAQIGFYNEFRNTSGNVEEGQRN
jgi:hypothetical protein